MPPVASSALITSLAEAREYYRFKLGGLRRLDCKGTRVAVIFPVDIVHVYSEKKQPGPHDVLVTQQIAVAVSDVRVFSLRRARLMDHIQPAISQYTVAIMGQGAKGKENIVLHGPALLSGSYMRVVLKPSRNNSWTCVSAFPVDAHDYRQACKATQVKFPP